MIEIETLTFQLNCFARDLVDRNSLEDNSFKIQTKSTNMNQLIKETVQIMQKKASLQKSIVIKFTDNTIKLE